MQSEISTEAEDMLKRFIKFILKAAKFNIDYTVPPEAKKCVMAFAPHTSMWDFVVGKLVFVVMGVKIKFLIKADLFWFPLGVLLRKLGGIPVDRKNAKTLPVYIGDIIKSSDEMAVLVAPEGTRKSVTRWKKGFYFIAEYAGVPICLSYLDWKTKRGGIGPVFYPTGDFDKDIVEIQRFYKGMEGKNSEWFNL